MVYEGLDHYFENLGVPDLYLYYVSHILVLKYLCINSYINLKYQTLGYFQQLKVHLSLDCNNNLMMYSETKL